MRLFDEVPPRPPRTGAGWEQHRSARQSHVGPPQDEIGVPAMSSFALARSEDVAVAVRGITAFSDGLLVSVVVLFSDEQRRETVEWSLAEFSRSPGRFRLGVELPSGARATTGTKDAPIVDSGDHAAALVLQTATTSPLLWQGEYWLWPVPEEGTMIVGCCWPDRGIEESLVALDTAPLIEAAGSSKPVWQS